MSGTIRTLGDYIDQVKAEERETAMADIDAKLKLVQQLVGSASLTTSSRCMHTTSDKLDQANKLLTQIRTAIGGIKVPRRLT